MAARTLVNRVQILERKVERLEQLPGRLDEANYSLEGILKGARLAEAEAAKKKSGQP